MLEDSKLFQTVEKILNERGVIQRFENENGKIIGRMMITLGEVPENLKAEICIDDGDFTFIGTFDFYDSEIGLVMNTKTRKLKSGLWINEQKAGAEPPSEDWCHFFIETLVKSIHEDGTFGYPLYTFCSSTGDFTVVPESPDA